MMRFVDDDAAYFTWLPAHPEGLVVNCYRNPTPSYLMLHRATCHHIQRWDGRRSTCDYIKVCADAEGDLREWAATVGGVPTRCRSCQP